LGRQKNAKAALRSAFGGDGPETDKESRQPEVSAERTPEGRTHTPPQARGPRGAEEKERKAARREADWREWERAAAGGVGRRAAAAQ